MSDARLMSPIKWLTREEAEAIWPSADPPPAPVVTVKPAEPKRRLQGWAIYWPGEEVIYI